MACPSASSAALGVRGYSGSAPTVFVSGQGNEISLYDLQDFRTRLRIRGWLPRRPPEPVRPEALATDDIADVNAAQLPALSREGFRAMLPLPSGGLICAGARSGNRTLTATLCLQPAERTASPSTNLCLSLLWVVVLYMYGEAATVLSRGRVVKGIA